MDAAIHNPSAPRARYAANLVPPQGVAGVHADADNIPGFDAFRHNLFDRFIYKDGRPGRSRCCRCEHKQPSGSDDSRAKGIIAGIDQVDSRKTLPFQVCA